jgi:hypothetical protein
MWPRGFFFGARYKIIGFSKLLFTHKYIFINARYKINIALMWHRDVHLDSRFKINGFIYTTKFIT